MMSVLYLTFMNISCTSGYQQDHGHSHEPGEAPHTHDQPVEGHEHTEQEEFTLEDTTAIKGSEEPHDHDHGEAERHTH